MIFKANLVLFLVATCTLTKGNIVVQNDIQNIDHVSTKIEQLKNITDEYIENCSMGLNEMTESFKTDSYQKILSEIEENSRNLTELYNTLQKPIEDFSCDNLPEKINNEEIAATGIAENLLTEIAKKNNEAESQFQEFKEVPEKLMEELDNCLEDTECIEEILIKVDTAIDEIAKKITDIYVQALSDIVSIMIDMENAKDRFNENYDQIRENLKTCFLEHHSNLLNQLNMQLANSKIEIQNDLETFQTTLLKTLEENQSRVVKEKYEDSIREIEKIQNQKVKCESLKNKFVSKYSNPKLFSDQIEVILNKAVNKENESLIKLEKEIGEALEALDNCGENLSCAEDINNRTVQITENLPTDSQTILNNLQQSIQVDKLLDEILEEIEIQASSVTECFKHSDSMDEENHLEILKVVVKNLDETTKENADNLSKNSHSKSITSLESYKNELENYLQKEYAFLEYYENLSTQELKNCTTKKDNLELVKITFESLFTMIVEQQIALINETVAEILEEINIFTEVPKNLEVNLKNCDLNATCVEIVQLEALTFSKEIPLKVQTLLTSSSVKLERNQLNINDDSKKSVTEFIKALRIESRNYIECLFEENGITLHEQIENDVKEIVGTINGAKTKLFQTYVSDVNNFQISLLVNKQGHLNNAYNLFEKELDLKQELASSYYLDVTSKCLTKRGDLETSLENSLKDLEALITNASEDWSEKLAAGIESVEKLLKLTSFLHAVLDNCDYIDLECIQSGKVDNDKEISKLKNSVEELVTDFKNEAESMQGTLNSSVENLVKDAVTSGETSTKEMAECIEEHIKDSNNSGIVFESSFFTLLICLIVTIIATN